MSSLQSMLKGKPRMPNDDTYHYYYHYYIIASKRHLFIADGIRTEHNFIARCFEGESILQWRKKMRKKRIVLPLSSFVCAKKNGFERKSRKRRNPQWV